jgi:hypothetical protein
MTVVQSFGTPEATGQTTQCQNLQISFITKQPFIFKNDIKGNMFQLYRAIIRAFQRTDPKSTFTTTELKHVAFNVIFKRKGLFCLTKIRTFYELKNTSG